MQQSCACRFSMFWLSIQVRTYIIRNHEISCSFDDQEILASWSVDYRMKTMNIWNDIIIGDHDHDDDQTHHAP